MSGRPLFVELVRVVDRVVWEGMEVEGWRREKV